MKKILNIVNKILEGMIDFSESLQNAGIIASIAFST